MATGDDKYEALEKFSNLASDLQSVEQPLSSENEDSSCDISTHSKDQWTYLTESVHEAEIAEDYLQKRRFARALDLFNEIYKERKMVLGQHHVVTLDAESNLALTRKLDGRLDNALKLYKHVYVILRDNVRPDHERTRKTLLSVAEILKRQKKYVEAFDYYDLLDDGTEHQQDMAKKLYSKGKYDEALIIYHKMHKRDAKRYGLDDPETTLIHKHFVGKMLSFLNRHREASHYFTEVIEARKKSFREFPELCAQVIEDFAHLFADLKGTKKEMHFLRNLHSEADKFLGPDHEYTLFVFFHLGYALASRRMYEEALEVYEDLFKKQINKDEDSIDAVQMNLPIVNMHMALGNYSKAQEVLDQAKEKLKLFESCDISFKNVIDISIERQQFFIESFTAMRGFRKRNFDMLILGLLMPWFKKW